MECVLLGHEEEDHPHVRHWPMLVLTLQNASHLIIAEKLHDALFTYLNKFSKSWHVDAANWKKNFQFLSATLFDRNKSGVCMIHMARYFNGIGLATKLDNVSLYYIL